MSRSRRIFLLPALAVSAALLLVAPASALPAFLGGESGWARVFEPLVRLFATDSNGRQAAAPAEGNASTGLFANEGWLIDPNGLVAPPPPNQGTQTPPHV